MKKVLILLFVLSATIMNAQTSRKNERTSPKVASTAGKMLRNPKSTKAERSVAGSALTQTADKPRRKRKN